MSDRVKVVLDTNILVSALWSDNGNCATIVKLMPDKIIPCINDAILEEYTEVLNRPKFDFSIHKKEKLLSKIKEHGEVVTADVSDFTMTDETDRIFYDTAEESGATLITGNIDDYPTEPFIVKPADFLKSINIDE